MPILTLPYPVSTNRMHRRMGGRIVKSEDAARYQRNARILAVQAGIKPLNGPIHLDVTLHPKKPARATKGASVRSIDLSNSIKCAEDALNGIAWADDRQVESLSARRGHPITGGALIVRWNTMVETADHV